MTEVAEPSTEWLPRLHEIGQFVHRTVLELQDGYLHDRSYAVAALAVLRRASGQPPGAAPEAWEHTLQGLPSSGWEADEPSRNEVAAHTAITLYAFHQQSRRVPVHVRGRGLGQAARRLIDLGASEEAVTRRFHAVGLASTVDTRTYHLRAFITQLRGGGGRVPIALDYGLLADQLVRLQNPKVADRVRLAWGREFVRSDRSQQSTSLIDETENDL